MTTSVRKALISEQDVYSSTPLQQEDIEEAVQDGSLTIYGTADGMRLFAVDEIRALVHELYEEDENVTEVDNPSGFEPGDFEL